MIHIPFIWIVDAVFFTFYFIKLIKENNKKIIIIISMLFLLKTISSLSIFCEYSSLRIFLADIVRTPLNYLYFIALFDFITKINKKEIKTIFIVYKGIFIFIQLGIILGLFLEFNFFNTYPGGRFGISGILFPNSTASYYTILNICIFYFYNERIERISSLYIILGIITSLLIGTKAVYFFIICFLFFLVLYKKLYLKLWFIILFISLSTSLIIQKNRIITLIKYKFIILYEVFKNENIITFLLSYRDKKLKNMIVYINERWNIYNYFIGGVNAKENLTELGLVDLILNFGIIGLILLAVLYAQHLKKIKFSISVFTFTLIFLIIFILSGNLFNSTVLAYPLSFLLLIMTFPKKDNHGIIKN